MRERCRSARLAALGVLALIPIVAPAEGARLHLRLTRAEPAAGDTVRAPVSALRLWFSEDPSLPVTRVRLTDAQGAAVTLASPTHDAGVANPVVAALRAPLAAGRYTVSWRSASGDGHPQSGEYSFVVAAGANAK